MEIKLVPSELNLNPIDPINDKVGLYAAMQWHKFYSPFVPRKEGVLEESVQIQPWEIHHNQIYARYQYYGEGFNFRKQPHPKASARWDQAAIPTQLPKLEQAVQAYIDSGQWK